MSIETRLRQTGGFASGGGGGSSNSGGLAGTGGLFVVTSASPLLPQSRILTAGSSVTTVTDSTSIYITAITAGFATTGTLISTTYPLAGGGDLSTNRTHTVDTAFLVSSNRTITSVFPLSGGGDLSANRVFSATTGGFFVLSSRLINTTSPAGGGGNLGADITITVGSLSTIGSANQFLRVNTDNATWGYINFRAGSSTVLSQGSGFIQIDATTGGGASSSAGLAGTGAFYLVTSGNSTLPNAVTYVSAATGFYPLNPQAALLYPSNSAARIDAATGFFRLLYSATTAQAGKWQWLMPQDYSGSPSLRLLFSNDSSMSVSKTVIWYVDVWGQAPNTQQGFLYTDTWSSVNTANISLSSTYTAGVVSSALITLSNVVSWQAGNFVRLRLTQSGGTTVANTELLAAMLEYTRA